MKPLHALLRGAAVLVAAVPLVSATLPERVGLVVAIDGLRNHRGLIQACLTADPITFPDCNKDPAALHRSVSALGEPQIHFDGVMPGRYAVALFHDENANGRMDKLLMVPREGFGFSRDAPLRMGPPRFDAAALNLHDAEAVTHIQMRYLL